MKSKAQSVASDNNASSISKCFAIFSCHLFVWYSWWRGRLTTSKRLPCPLPRFSISMCRMAWHKRYRGFGMMKCIRPDAAKPRLWGMLITFRYSIISSPRMLLNDACQAMMRSAYDLLWRLHHFVDSINRRYRLALRLEYIISSPLNKRYAKCHKRILPHRHNARVGGIKPYCNRAHGIRRHFKASN